MEKILMKFLLLPLALLTLSQSAFADTGTETAYGSTKLNACTNAKNEARAYVEVYPYNFAITSFGTCECEQSSSNEWRCDVDYTYLEVKK
jgi:hypothetical protein